MRRALCLVLLVGMVIPAGASAVTLPTDRPLTTTRATESLRIAREFWHADVPCLRIYTLRTAALNAGVGDQSVIGAAIPDGCAIWLRASRQIDTFVWRISDCTTVVHEYGHILGLGHNPSPRSVMRAERDNNDVVYACYKRFMPQGWARQWRAMYGAPFWLAR